MENVQQTIIMNDDCVEAIIRKMSFKDLISTVRVSKQFKRVSQLVFRSKFRKLHLSNQIKRLNIRKMRTIFKSFGHLMEEFRTASNFYPYFNKIMQIELIKHIKKYCSRKGYKLETLELRYFYNIDRHLNDLQRIFKHLKEINLEYTIIPGSLKHLLNKLPNAKYVTLNNCSPLLGEYNSSKAPCKSVEINMNLNLEKLHLRCRQDVNIVDILADIDRAFPNIRDLRFEILGIKDMSRDYGEKLRNIAKLKQLEALDIDLQFREASPLMRDMAENKVRLKILKWRYTYMSEGTMEDLYKLTGLEELYFFNLHSPEPFDMMAIASNLTNLRIVSITAKQISIETLTKIIGKLKNLSHGEFEIQRNEIWTADNFGKLIETIRKQGKNFKTKLSLHTVSHNLHPPTEHLFLQSQRFNPYVSINRYFNRTRSIFQADWNA